MCCTDQYSRWPYAPSWFPNRQHTRNTNLRYHLLTCATVQSVSAPPSLSSFLVFETSLTTIWLLFQLKHLLCFIFNVRGGRAPQPHTSWCRTRSVIVSTSVRGLNTRERLACHADTRPGLWCQLCPLARKHPEMCTNPSLPRELQSDSSARRHPNPIFCKITKKDTSQPLYLSALAASCFSINLPARYPDSQSLFSMSMHSELSVIFMLPPPPTTRLTNKLDLLSEKKPTPGKYSSQPLQRDKGSIHRRNIRASIGPHGYVWSPQ